VGDLSLLTRSLLGIVGSRDVSEAAAAIAQDAARAATSAGWGVVSGGAKGVDSLALHAALDSGGVVVSVLADSLTRAVRDPQVRHAVTDGRLCLCTPYRPSAGFSVASAMGRNKIIYALSKATLVVTSDEGKGGTWAGAEEALKRSLSPVMVWSGTGAGPGNQPLIAKGATAVDQISLLLPRAMSAEPTARPTTQLHLGV
jgi:predicted Rossmann fold nucleotide-binding protein DprA/Smf involved in DNA uptake